MHPSDPQDPDETEPPILGVIDGGKSTSKHTRKDPTPKKLTLEDWKNMEKWWLRKDRSIAAFSRHFKISERHGHRIVHKGVRGWPPLKERAAEYDLIEKSKDAAATQSQIALELSEWGRTKRSNLTAIRNARAIISVVQNELIADLSSKGERPLANTTVAQKSALVSMARLMGTALKDLGDEERKWIHGIAPADDKNDDSPLSLLTEDQIAYIEENNGRLPPGVDPAQVDAFFKRLGIRQG